MKNLIKKINWKKCNGLVPAIIQNANNNMVLMLGYMNKESLTKTLENKNVWFYSKTRKRLWMKGETSGNILNVMDIKLDCDKDVLLIKARPFGPTCHNGNYSCFKERKKIKQLELFKLFETIQDRKEKMPKKSYTTSLFKEGLNKILLKVAEEALEVVQAAQKQTKRRLIEETVDLIYHLFVLLVGKKISLTDIKNEINKRQKTKKG